MDDIVIKNLIELCKNHYNESQFYHCQDIANYALENPIVIKMDIKNKNYIFCIAYCHDLIEDTDCTYGDIAEVIANKKYNPETINDINVILSAIRILTKSKNDSYNDYIQNIKDSENEFAYIVKLADMKDHLSKTETLTDKLKKKYWDALPILL